MNAPLTIRQKITQSLEGEPETLRGLISAAVGAADALNALTRANVPLPDERVLWAAEGRAWDTREALLDHLLFEHGVGSAMAADLGRIL